MVKSFWRQWKDGEITTTEYNNMLARKRGYKDFNDYNNQRRHRLGLHKPIDEDKNSSQYLGIVVAERVLSKVFKDVKRTPMTNEGYDFICRRGYKIDVKSSCLNESNFWHFAIKRNKIADYFLFLAFDNREDLNPKRIWLIKGTEIIKTENLIAPLNERQSFWILNTRQGRKRYKKYRKTDKLRETISCCNVLRE